MSTYSRSDLIMGKRADKNRRKMAKLQKLEQRLDGVIRLGTDRETSEVFKTQKQKVVAEISNLEHAREKHRRHSERAKIIPDEPRHRRGPSAVALATAVRLIAEVADAPLASLKNAYVRANDMIATAG